MKLEIWNREARLPLRLLTLAGLILFLSAMVLISGCSSCQPVLYPNTYYHKVGPEQAEQDIKTVMLEAKNHKLDYASSRNRRLAKTTARSAAGSGARLGADALSGGLGAGSAVSAAGSGVPAAIDWMFGDDQPDPMFKKYVETRLREKGYQVLGWK